MDGGKARGGGLLKGCVEMLLEVLRSKIWIYLTAHLEMLKNRHRGISGAARGCDPESLRCSEAAEKTGELRNERRILPLGLV